MTAFTIHTVETAPEASKPILDEVKKPWGAVPNLNGVLAEAPAALEGYGAFWSIFEKISFSAAERQVVYLSAIFENVCRYCMAGHSVLGKMSGLSPLVISALRDGTPLPDAELEALHKFTGAVVRNRGFVAESDLAACYAADYGRQQALEVILGVSVKTISNYTNHIAETPLDPFMSETLWAPRSERNVAA